MDRNIIPLKRDTANRAFRSEWAHQLDAIEKSLGFFQEYFLWASQRISTLESVADAESAPECAMFYASEAPAVLEESRESLRVLRLLSHKCGND